MLIHIVKAIILTAHIAYLAPPWIAIIAGNELRTSIQFDIRNYIRVINHDVSFLTAGRLHRPRQSFSITVGCLWADRVLKLSLLLVCFTNPNMANPSGSVMVVNIKSIVIIIGLL